jgi:DNA-binding beta-propeller fold protein YncE
VVPFRQPIPVPLPVIPQSEVPTYATAVYGAQRPSGVAVSPSGDRIYVTQSEGDRTGIVFDADRNKVGTMAPPEATGTDHVPVYMAVDPLTSEVYVSDHLAGTVYIYDRDGAYQRELTLAVPRPGWQPLGLAFDKAGNLYVTDLAGPYQKVLVIDRSAQVARTLGENDKLSFLNGVGVDGAGNVFVTDSNNGRLHATTPKARSAARSAAGPARGTWGSRAGSPWTVAAGCSWPMRPARVSSSTARQPATAAASTTWGSSGVRAWRTRDSSTPTASRSTRAVACTWRTRSTTACRSGATEAPGNREREVAPDGCSPPIVAAH